MPERQPLSRFPFSTPHPADCRVKDGGCCLKRKPQPGIRQFGRSLKGVIEPVPKVTVGKQIQAEQGHQATERQFVLGAEPEIFEQQHGNQCCPNLCFQSIGAGADEGLDLQVLLEHLEEEFDLPAVPVYPANGTERLRASGEFEGALKRESAGDQAISSSRNGIPTAKPPVEQLPGA